MSKLYSTLYKSVVRAVNDLVKQVEATIPNQPVRYWAWEDRMDEDKLPREMLIGVNGFTLEENRGMWLIRFGITLSTIDDANLMIEADVIDLIHSRFGEDRTIRLLDPESGDQTSELVSTHFEVLPMGQTQVRNYRPMGLELKRTGT